MHVVASNVWSSPPVRTHSHGSTSSTAPAREAARIGAARANNSSSSAEGRVKPHQAASAPGQPARSSPSENPTWLEAGPGRN